MLAHRNKHKPTNAWACTHANTCCILMREGAGTVKATAEWNLLTKDWPAVQGRQQLGGELLSQRWSEGCTTEAAHADGTGKTNWLNGAVASAQLLYGKKASSLLYIFFTHCLFVSLLCFLCPLPRQRCRWIGAVSVRDLCVISWNVHPSKHKKLHFKLFELYFFLALFHWHSASLLRSNPCFVVEIYFIWAFGVHGQHNSQLASPTNKLCKLKIVQSLCMKNVTTRRMYKYVDAMQGE